LAARFAFGAETAAIAEVTLILTGWSLAEYPRLITPDITIFNAAAPEVTLRLLTYALVAGAIGIVSVAFFLVPPFQGKRKLMPPFLFSAGAFHVRI